MQNRIRLIITNGGGTEQTIREASVRERVDLSTITNEYARLRTLILKKLESSTVHLPLSSFFVCEEVAARNMARSELLPFDLTFARDSQLN